VGKIYTRMFGKVVRSEGLE